MFEKFKFWIIVLIALLLVGYILPARNLVSNVIYAFFQKNELSISLTLANPEVKRLAVDKSNKLVLQVQVKDSTGADIQNAQVNFTVSGHNGEIYPKTIRTNRYGEGLATYVPPPGILDNLKQGDIDVTLTAGINKTSITSSVGVKLTRTPVVLIHGYHASGQIFQNLQEHLGSKGLESSAINYKSQEGIISSAKELEGFLDEQKMVYLSKGLQVKKFDIVAHSMGGLVARYYSCSPDYFKKDNIRKLIFLSVPHRGSHWALLGEGLFNDQTIKDLIPDNPLLSKVFPTLLNKGLNNTIQVGNMIGQYDEVVPLESSNLDEWSINTEIFNIGENNFTVDNLLNGSIVEAVNHKAVLNNKKVFERIEEMLGKDLPYPTLKK